MGDPLSWPDDEEPVKPMTYEEFKRIWDEEFAKIQDQRVPHIQQPDICPNLLKWIMSEEYLKPEPLPEMEIE